MALPIIPRCVYETIEPPEKFTESRAAIGSGPYVLKKYDKVQGQYLFEAFPAYYQGPGRVTRNGEAREVELIAVKRFEGDAAIISHQLEKQGIKVNSRVLNQAASGRHLSR